MPEHFKKILMIFIFLFILFIIIPGSFAYENQTDLQVEASDVLADETIDIYFDASAVRDGDGSKENPYNSINPSKLKNGSNIYFEEGNYVLESDALNLKDVNLYGKNPEKTVISARYFNWDVLNVNARGTFTVSNLTFKSLHFNVADGMDACNSIFTMYSVYDKDDDYGGVIHSASDTFSTINIDGCKFYYCTACYGATIFCDNGVLIVNNTNFYDNDVHRYGSNLFDEGGAICINNSIAKIQNSYFTSNFADDSSGAILALSSSLEVDNCMFTDNQADFGSAISVRNGNMTVSKSTFKNNREDNGAIYGYLANIVIKNTLFENNVANYGGGVIFVENTTLTVTSSSFKKNSAKVSGGSIYSSSSKVRISGTVFESDHSDRSAGSIYSDDSNLNLDKVTINEAKSLFGAGITGLSSNVSLDEVMINNCSATYYGGAIYNSYGTLSISDSSLIKNSADAGGALYIDYGLLNVHSTNFTNNTANVGTAGYIYQADDNLKNVTFKNNEFYSSQAFDYFVGSGNYTMMIVDDSFSGDLPKRYDPRDYGILTPVSNQLVGDYCWAFSVISVLESCIIKATGNPYEFSENNVINLNKKYSVYGLNTSTQSGNPINTLGYLLSWLGPINASDDEYDLDSKLSPVLDSLMHVQNVVFLNMNFDESDQDTIKEAIIRYGAVDTSIRWIQSEPYEKGSSYYYDREDDLPDHAIALVGWDDNYSRYNFNITPPGDGAWICKNTWGSEIGDGGYFYISYYSESLNYEYFKDNDDYINLDHVFTFILNDTIRLDKNYQYDYAGPTNSWTLDNHAAVKNVFTATDDEYLAAVSTYFIDNSEYELSIYVNDELVLNQSSTTQPGYYTINLNRLIPLKVNDTFAVVFNITSLDSDKFTVYCTYKEDVIADIYGPGISFYAYPGFGWNDACEDEEGCAVICIKAFTILNKIDTSLELSFDTTGENPVTLTATVVDGYGRKLNYGNVTFNLDGKNYTVNVSNGVARITHIFENEVSNVTATFNGDGYEQSTDSGEVDITRVKVNLDLNIKTNLKTVVVDIAASPNINTTVEVYINDMKRILNLTNGKTTLKLDDLPYGNYKVEVGFNDTQKQYGKANGTFFIDVYKSTIIALDFETYSHSKETYTVRLVDENNKPISGKTVSFNINGTPLTGTSDSNGKVSVIIDLEKGNYRIIATFKGDDKYTAANASNNLKVRDMIVATVNVYRNLRDVNIEIAISQNINLKVNVDGNLYRGTLDLTNGKQNLKFANLEDGNYNMSVYLNDDDYIFIPGFASFSISISQTTLVANDMITYSGSNAAFSVKLLDKDNKPVSNMNVSYELDGKLNTVNTGKQGVVSIPINLALGSYPIKVDFAGFEDYLPSNITKTISVVKTLELPSVSVYTFNSQYKVKLYDFNGNPLANAPVDFAVDGATKRISTDGSGVLTFDVNLNVASHVIKVTNPETGEAKSQNINVKARLSGNKDITMYYGAGNSYKVKVLDDNGNPAKNVKVYIYVGSSKKKVITGSDGYAVLKITQNPGKYTLSLTYKGYKVTNKLTVKTTLITKDITVKRGKTIQFSAKLLNSKGKIIKYKKVKFKFRGTTYNIKTNNKGIATLKLSSKKMKSGKYTVKTTYGSLTVSNKIKIK